MSKKKQRTPLVDHRLQSLFDDLEQEAALGKEVPASLPTPEPESGTPLTAEPAPLEAEEIPSPTAAPHPVEPEAASPREAGLISPRHEPFPPSRGDSLPSFQPIYEPASQATNVSTLTVPFQLQEQGMGLLEIVDDKPDRLWTQDEQRLVEQVADQLSLALENAQLFQAEQRRSSELNTLVELGRLISQNLDLEQIYSAAYRIIGQVMSTDQFFINLYDPQTKEFITAFDIEQDQRVAVTRFPADKGYSGHVLRTGQAYFEADLLSEYSPIEKYSTQPHARSIASLIIAPLRFSGEIVGVISAQSFTPQAYSEYELGLLQTYADTIAVGIQNARLFDSIQRRAQELAVVNDLTSAISQRLEIVSLIETVYQQVQRVASVDAFYISLYDGVHDLMSFPLAFDSGERFSYPARKLVSGSAAHQVLTSGEMMLIARTPEEVAKMQLSEQGSMGNINRPSCTLLYIPLRIGGQVTGIFSVQSYQFNAYSQQDVAVMTAIANNVAIALQNARLFQETQTALSETATLYSITSAASHSLDLENALQEMLQQVLQAIHFESGLISLVDQSSGILALAVQENLPQPMIEVLRGQGLQGTLCEASYQSRQALAINDLQEESERAGVEKLLQWGFRAYNSVPLVARDQVLGTLCAFSTQVAAAENAKVSLLQTAAQQIGIAIENANLFHETQTRAGELAILNEMSRALSAQLNVQEVLENIYRYTSRLVDTTNFYLALYDPIADEVTFPLAVEDNERRPWRPRKPRKGLTEHVLQTRESLLIKSQVIEFLQETLGLEALGRAAACWLGVPLIIGEQAVGMFAVQSYTMPGLYSERDRDMMNAIASQAAIAIQNARLFEETQTRAEQLAALNELTRSLSEQLDVQQVLDTVYKGVSRLVDTTNFYVGIYNPEDHTISFVLNVTESEVDRDITVISADEGLSGYIVRTRQSLLVSDNIIEFQQSLGVAIKGEPARSWLGVPMVLGEQVLGVIAVQSYTRASAYNEQDRSILSAIGSQAAIAIQNARLFEESRQRTEELSVLNEMSRTLTTLLDIDAIAEAIYTFTTRLMTSDFFMVTLYDAKTQEVSFPVARYPHESVHAPTHKLTESGSMTEYIIQNRCPLLLNGDLPPQIASLGIKVSMLGEKKPPLSWLGVPILYSDQVAGVISLQRLTDPTPYTQNHLTLLTAIANQVANAIQNARLFAANQAALQETEALYEASQEMNVAQSYDDILEALKRHTVIGQGANMISLCFFDRVWTKTVKPEFIEVAARLTTLPAEQLAPHYPLKIFPSIEHMLTPDDALVVEDIANDPRPDENIRRVYLKNLEALSAVFIPLVVSGQWIGFINGSYPQQTHFPEADLRQALALSTQASVAVQNLRSVAIAEQRAREAQQRSEELGLINRVVSTVVSYPDLRVVLETVTQELVNTFHLAHSGVALLNESGEQLTLVAESSSTNDPSSVGILIPVRGNPSSEQVIQTKKTLVIEDVQNSPLTLLIQDILKQRHIQSLVLLPLIASGKVIGTVGLDIATGKHILTPQEIALAETLVGQVATAIENARLFEQTQNALAETATLYRASAELNAAQTYDAILSVLRQSTVLGNPSTSYTSLNIYDRPWISGNLPEWYTAIARWSLVSEREPSNPRNAFSAWASAEKFLRPDQPTMIADAEQDSRVDKTARALLLEKFGGKSMLFAPLVVAGQWIGHVTGVYNQSASFSEAETRPLMALAAQAAVAIQNLRLFEETRRRATQLETAAEIARDTSGTLALDILLKRGVNLIRERYGYYHASIFLLDDSGLNAIVRESTGEAGEEMKRRGHKLAVGSQSVIGYVTQAGAPLVINNVSQSPIFRPNPLLPETRAELGIPLKIGYRVIGAMDVQATQIEAFSPDDVSVLQTLADQFAVAVDNARSYEIAQQAINETRKRVQELSVLFNIGQSLASAPLESSEIAGIVVRQFIEILDIPEASISLFEEGNLRVVADVIRNPDAQIVSSEGIGHITRLADYPATVRVMRTLQPLIVQASDPHADSAEVGYMRQRNIATLLMLPMAIKGQAIGIIELESWERERIFTPEQMNLATAISNAAAVSLENARLYEEQRKATEQLREVDKLKSQFLANMSHELRTPLNSIIGFSRVILKGIDGPISDMQQQDLSAINSAGQHLLNLINDILDISKIEAGKMELAFDSNVNLHDIINGAMSFAIGLVKDKPVKLERQISQEIPAVRADPTRIRQVLINFLSNAAKFTDEGVILVRAAAQTSPEGKPEVLISVTDSGPGISEEDQKKLFQPFTQVDASPTRKVGGTGLGLSISRRLMDLHGGRIGVESTVGKGSTFYFTLPLPYQEMPQGDAAELPQKTILAIDDDRQVISLYERYLQGHGYQIIPLTDPKTAVDRARELQPYAITLDVMMPERNGWDVLKALKENPETRNIPVIICSIVEDHEKGFSLGAAYYLTKPILQDDLVNALKCLNGDGSIRDVLVIDDDADDLRLVQKILEENGQYEVRLAKGGPDGLVAIQARPPQAIVLDLFMPGLDGFTLLETLRADPTLQEIPVIIFTAGDLTEEQLQRLAEFSQTMIRKSVFKEQDLLASIEHALERFKK